ncbi:MAG: hypothetical protein JWO38_2701 [Gemmataceae bacterium]|nr:hypothetical protein [Gemmataceae bacterium]
MAQLAGCNCVICGIRIEDVSETRFCDGCGNPIHNSCVAKPDKLCGGVCADCGANLTDAALMRSRDEKINRPIPHGTGPYPVSVACPKCESPWYIKVKPEQFTAFWWDRVCTLCHTRYTPPTPRWAGIIFVFGGVLLLVLAVSGSLFFVLAGLLSIAHGIRCLRSPGRGQTFTDD